MAHVFVVLQKVTATAVTTHSIQPYRAEFGQTKVTLIKTLLLGLYTGLTIYNSEYNFHTLNKKLQHL